MCKKIVSQFLNLWTYFLVADQQCKLVSDQNFLQNTTLIKVSVIITSFILYSDADSGADETLV